MIAVLRGGRGAVKRRLKMLKYRPDVVDGCLAGTGLAMEA